MINYATGPFSSINIIADVKDVYSAVHLGDDDETSRNGNLMMVNKYFDA